ncbi:hypothetical protein V8E55_003284 [Tylopilus felleus]
MDKFMLPILDMCNILIRSLLMYTSFSKLRKIKQEQEDILASIHMDRSRMFKSVAAACTKNKAHPTLRKDVATLYSLFGVLYMSLPPERALQF